MQKLLRLPIIHPLNTRVSATNPLPASSGVVGIGVVGIMVVGQAVDPSAKDVKYINCFKRTVGEQVYCVKRSGLAALNTPQSGSIGTAALVWTGCAAPTSLVTAFGGTNSSIYIGTDRLASNHTDTTVITGKATSISETTVSNTPTLYITSSDNTGWYYQPGGTLITGTVTKITDAQFPGNNSLTLAGFGAHMDGFTYQMDTLGGIWNTDLNSMTSWTATGVINANAYPDKGIGCIRFKTYLMGFGTESVEFYFNAGNAQGSPLTRIPNMAMKIGATHADAITAISDNVFWCGSTPQGGLSIYQYDGTLARISPPEIDAVLLLAGASNIKLAVYPDYGLHFVIVKAGSSLYEYCIEEKFWFTRQIHLGHVRFVGLSSGSTPAI